jgi:hypothetical protein
MDMEIEKGMRLLSASRESFISSFVGEVENCKDVIIEHCIRDLWNDLTTKAE